MSAGVAGTGAPAGARGGGAAVAGFVLLVVSLAAAVSVDVVRGGYGIKSDEATYVMMALSAAYDHDLAYERRDLERFSGLYRGGPEGVFLKRGKRLRIRLRGRPPFLFVTKLQDPEQNQRLYFGKAFIYPIAAAPFVRLLGLRGMLVFHVLLLFGVCVCAYTFLAARSRPGPALVLSLGFVGASVAPVYAAFLMPEIFNFALVFYAYFLWLYKEVAPRGGFPWLRGRASDVAAAVLLGAATYSKPTHALLIAPIVLLSWWRRRFLRGAMAGLAFAAAAAGLFGANALVSGELNYQGGDRKTFYGRFPFDGSGAAWDQRGIQSSTNDSDAESVLAPSELANRFGHNVEYFLVGRHFGFVPYFFPGVVAIGLWLFSRERSEAWRVLTFLTVAASEVIVLLFLPYSWSGGGGPPGNRYFLSLYSAVFFLTPPVESLAPGVLAWAGGALFTARLLIDPFGAAKFPYLMAEHGAVRRLPVELTMANDLPIMLDPHRSHLPYGHDPTVLLYFLDENAYPPDPAGIWVSGSGRSDIVVRTEHAIDRFTVAARSPIHTVFTVSAGAAPSQASLAPNRPATLQVAASGVKGLRSYEYLLSVRSSDAFVPHLQDPSSTDFRNLGVLIELQAVEGADATGALARRTPARRAARRP